MIEILEFILSFTGLGALLFKIYEEYKGYLKMKITVEKNTIYTEIENTSKWNKKIIDNSFIIISPESSDLIEVGCKIAQNLEIENSIRYTNDFGCLLGSESIYIDNQIGFIPLDFYFNENIAVGDEKLTYRCSLDLKQLQADKYSARFYIYSKNRYHRSTQDLFIVNGKCYSE